MENQPDYRFPSGESVPPVISVADVVRWLGISRDAVYNAIASGELPCRKLTRRQYLVTPQAVLAWLESR